MRILTIDDHGMFRYGLRLTLEQQFADAEILEAATVREGIEIARTSAPLDLALVDLHMPGEDGVDAIETICRLVPETVVAALTASDDRQDILRVMEAGAMGFIRKSFGPEVLKSVIEIILSGERFYPVAEMDADPAPDPLDGQGDDLDLAEDVRFTPRQMEILRGLLNGLSNKEIARELGIIEGTVKAHIRTMMGNVGVKNRTQLAIIATRLIT
ncbi:MAG: response regulator transcription factor [Alphaproteobacteria bacterium]|nr:response regulator transcription factor [Alphaproteobacteria bacterium]